MEIEWKISDQLVDYLSSLKFMQEKAQDIAQNQTSSCVWFLQHPPLYTAGTRSPEEDLSSPLPFPVHKTGRGGQITYHGPGQIVAYVLLNLKHWKCDVHWYVHSLEQWLINSLKEWNIEGYQKTGYPGIWVKMPLSSTENKIAALGVRIQKWVTLHGISLNISPNLDHFKAIVPCGIHQYGVTSLKELGISPSFAEVVKVLQKNFSTVF
jgi:lipoyl(octanoyl) transferase